MHFYKTTLRYPKGVIAIILVMNVFFGWQMGKVKMNNSIEALLPKSCRIFNTQM